MFEDIKQKYNTIVIDPPWNIQMQGYHGTRPNRPRKLQYNSMSLDEIKRIPINKIANVGCHVYCWTTNKMLPFAFGILKEWGVNYHIPLTFEKSGGILICNGFRSMTEVCLLGFYGKPMKKWNGGHEPNVFKGHNKAGKHSSKPDVFYDIVRKMSPNPRIDIFARRNIIGFDAWGDQVSSQETLIHNPEIASTKEVK